MVDRLNLALRFQSSLDIRTQSSELWCFWTLENFDARCLDRGDPSSTSSLLSGKCNHLNPQSAQTPYLQHFFLLCIKSTTITLVCTEDRCRTCPVSISSRCPHHPPPAFSESENRSILVNLRPPKQSNGHFTVDQVEPLGGLDQLEE